MKIKNKSAASLSALAVLIVVLGVAFFLVLGSVYRKAEHKETFSNVKFIAHRGLSSKYYENSEEAFAAAGKSDFFYGIETDVYFTADGVPVCSHDDNAFADSGVKITSSNYDDIKNLPLKKSSYGYTGKNICSFDRYLKICAEYGKVAVIELKQWSMNTEQIKTVTDTAKEICGDDFVIISFSKNIIAKVKEIDSAIVTQHLVEDHVSLRNSLTEGFNVSDYFRHMTKALVDESHGKGKKVGVWTVNNIGDIHRYATYGVDYITTDYDFS